MHTPINPSKIKIQATSSLPPLLSEHLDNSKPDLFPLGRSVYTHNVEIWAEENLPEELLQANLWLMILIRAHVTGCWDEMSPEDKAMNIRALDPSDEGRIFSAYTILEQKIYVITEWDRSVTTVLLAEDY